jgi:hypothetical protein
MASWAAIDVWSCVAVSAWRSAFPVRAIVEYLKGVRACDGMYLKGQYEWKGLESSDTSCIAGSSSVNEFPVCWYAIAVAEPDMLGL